jgi:paraquat-inducible protein B
MLWKSAMSDEPTDQSSFDELPEVAVATRGGYSIVWIIPLIAALIGGWLAYKTISEMGTTITITFNEGGGLEAGKTKIKYKSVDVGIVETVEISEDLSQVIVTATMNKETVAHLTLNTQFWVVRPQVGFSGISGLETLVSGAYIDSDPRPGEPTREFIGLETPPGVTAFEGGSQFQLRAEKLGSSYAGAPVLYRGINVGRILSHELAKDNQSVWFDIFIQAPHHLLVQDTSRFWQRSGIEASVNVDGIDVKMESLVSVIAGGVAFDTPVMAGGTGRPSKSGMVFELFENFSSIGEAKYVRNIPYLLHFDGSVRGLKVGAPVELKGIKVGSVTDIAVKLDTKTLNFEVPVAIEIQPDRILTPDDLEALDQINAEDSYSVGRMLVEDHGMRAQLQTGSLLTGQLFVDLEFHPDLPREPLLMTGKYPEIPTVPSTLDEFRRTATSVLEELRRLPLDKIAHELLETLKGAKRLTNSPDLMHAVQTLSTTLEDVQKLTYDVNHTVDSLASSTKETLAAARAALEVADPNSPTAVNLAHTLEELAAAARSIRILADYLEQHPESLVHGKSE